MTARTNIEGELVKLGSAWRYFTHRLRQQRSDSLLEETRKALVPLIVEMLEESARAFPDGKMTIYVDHGRTTVWVKPRLPSEKEVELFPIRKEGRDG